MEEKLTKWFLDLQTGENEWNKLTREKRRTLTDDLGKIYISTNYGLKNGIS